jgi:hypothetical protein
MSDSRIEKPIEWVASAKRDLKAMPEEVQDDVGYALDLAQRGLQADYAERMKGTSAMSSRFAPKMLRATAPSWQCTRRGSATSFTCSTFFKRSPKRRCDAETRSRPHLRSSQASTGALCKTTTIRLSLFGEAATFLPTLVFRIPRSGRRRRVSCTSSTATSSVGA